MSEGHLASARPLHGAWNRWLLLMLQLPVAGSNRRVKVWRRLQQIGALPIRNGVYALPNSAQAQEDFQWLKPEVEEAGGQVSIFAASAVEGLTDDGIVEQFQKLRAPDYAAFLKDARAVERRFGRKGMASDDLVRAVRQLRDRATRLQAIDFFGASGRDEAEQAVSALEERARQTPSRVSHGPDGRLDRNAYQRRTWVTRPRPGVDRFASAWLIATQIDQSPTFVFATEPGERPHAIAFDMFGGEFAHVGDRCTFEVLVARFAINDARVRRIAEIVHDLDLNDARYRPSEAAGVAAMVQGLRDKFADDATLLSEGMTLFDAVYRGLPMSKAPRVRAARARANGEKS